LTAASWPRSRQSGFRQARGSFGVGAARVTSPDHFRPALEKALADGGPYVISVEVPTDSEVSPWAFIHPAKNI
jgi:acetolactate synthase-1/2/3 large subunit